MSLLTEAEYKNIEKSGRGGVFIFCGDEGYLINHYRRRARAPYLEDELESYNYMTVTYSSSSDAEAIIDSAATPPMMSALGKKLIEVAVETPSALSAADMDALCGALTAAAAYEDNLVLWCISPGMLDLGTPPKRPSAIYKKLTALDGVSVVYFPVTTPAQLRRWIERHFTHSGLTPEHDTADALLTVSGTDMTVLSIEIDKLTAYVKGGGKSRVTAADVEAVCCRADKYDAFSLSNAILDGRRDDALAALEEERRRRTEPIIISSGIARVIADILSVKLIASGGGTPASVAARLGMHEYKAKLYMRAASSRDSGEIERAMLACAEADRLLKSSGGGYSVLERLICSIGARS